MTKTRFDYDSEIAWCPGCGDFRILDALKLALDESGLSPENVVVASGIGQGAKTPHYMKVNGFNGLHGRTLPVATGIKASNTSLTVVTIGGDGDMYGEGGNHFIHTIRRNPDITSIVCNNMIYGLTKGQMSPTTPKGNKTTTSPHGVTNEPFNPLAIAIVSGATFVARCFAGDVEETKNLIKEGIKHKGFALIDIFQPCVSFNTTNTWQWFKENTKWLDEKENKTDILEALKLSMETSPYNLGILYKKDSTQSFEDFQPAWNRGDNRPLFERKANTEAVKEFLKS